MYHFSVQETDRGSYFCQASNTFLQRAVSSRKIFLDVLAPPSVTILPLAVLSTVGAEVVIQCQVSGHPIPSVEWSKQGQSARTGGKVIMGVRNATLYISSVRTYDEGVYTCAASNSVGQDQKTTTLRIAAKPVIILFSGSVNVSKGATINVPCRAVGNLPIKYTWGKSGLQTALSLLPHIYIDDNKTLHISNAHQSDSGEYYCTAENDMGRDSKKTIITVFTGDHEEDILSTVPEINLEEPTNPANYNLKSYKDVYLRDSPRHSISDATPNVANTPFNNHDVINFVDRQKNDVRKSSELLPVAFHSKLQTNAQQSHSYITAPTPIIQHPDHPTLHPSLQAESWSVHTQFLRKTSRLSNQHASSLQDHLSPSSIVQGLGQLTQVTGFTNYNMNSMNSSTNTTDKEVNLSWSQPTEPLDATKASQTNNTEVVETLKKNTSKAPMRTTDNNAREKRKSQGWLPVIEEHDIPIVVGVGVSLAFIFITMSFYSLFRKNDPAAITTGRAAIRGPIGRPGERLAIERTYDNKAFEDDNMVAVIEQSPNTSETRAQRPASSPSTLLMEPSYEDAPEEVQPTRDFPVIVETHPDRDLTEEQLETSFEDGKITPPHPSDIQLQCMEDWRSPDLGQCQDPPSPTPVNTVGPQESLRSSLTLQTSESSSTPVHHSISLSHNSCPLMLSHCVTMGMTSIAVDVHFYPSVVQNSFSTSAPSSSTTFGPSRPQGGSRPEHDSAAPSAHNGK
ncbi:uncharacterized protein LOC134335307 [Trichomycterus rosablanca]|uniref:uncharacterized protein LOC134335307 n=1 Tax=Trichomycterus rosablanca TaxID=2290929 RepID=UPI002F35F44E